MTIHLHPTLAWGIAVVVLLQVVTILAHVGRGQMIEDAIEAARDSLMKQAAIDHGEHARQLANIADTASFVPPESVATIVGGIGCNERKL